MNVRRSLSVAAFLALCLLLVPQLVAGQINEPNFTPVPTLGGVGLGVMAGILAMGGAWVVSRNRSDKK